MHTKHNTTMIKHSNKLKQEQDQSAALTKQRVLVKRRHVKVLKRFQAVTNRVHVLHNSTTGLVTWRPTTTLPPTQSLEN